MSRDRFEVLERFIPLFETPESSVEGFLHRRDRQRRNKRIATGACAIALVVIALLVNLAIARPSDHTQVPVDTGPTVPSPLVGFIGLPPEGATPSTPETGELVVYVQDIPGFPSRTWVYADGRMIWHRPVDLPEGANEFWTGFLEQRLTPEGVELLRSEVVSRLADRVERPGVDDPGGYTPIDIQVRDEGRLVRVESPHGLGGLVGRIHDAASWLPAGAWEDREIRAYVPSRYQVCLGSRDLILLPEPAQDLVREAPHDESWVGVTMDDGTTGTRRIYCADLATEEVRALDEALADAGLGRDSEIDGYRGGPDPWSLTYRIDGGGEEIPAADRRYIGIEPYLPHGEAYCQHCDARFGGRPRP